jgi:hypothetical protein
MVWTRLAPGEYTAASGARRFRITRFGANRWGLAHSVRVNGRFRIVTRETARTLRAAMRRCESRATTGDA